MTDVNTAPHSPPAADGPGDSSAAQLRRQTFQQRAPAAVFLLLLWLFRRKFAVNDENPQSLAAPARH